MEKAWQRRLKENYQSVQSLKDDFAFSESELEELKRIEEKYPVSIPKYYIDLIDKSDRKDPIRKMCMPDLMEFSPGGAKDTSGEAENTVVQGMQHKYKETVLILSTNQCAMYCRHCFRKRLVGLSSEEIAEKLPEMARYVAMHPEITNVLISGGDAFLNSNEMIGKYLDVFTRIDHISFIRFGTRIPVSFPYRITEDDGELIGILSKYVDKKHIMVVTQFNHPKEITNESRKAIRMLSSAGCSIRNQTVLLKGVNDSPETLSMLMNNLVGIGVMPYYLFQCRPVEGVKNQFQVPFSRALDVVEEAKGRMSGPSKAFRYALSHPSGKIEVVAKVDDKVMFKYHQAKSEKDRGRVFFRPIDENECWF